jgi:uncharacterized protein YkwD
VYRRKPTYKAIQQLFAENCIKLRTKMTSEFNSMTFNIYAPSPQDGLESEEVKLYTLINQYRAENGLPPIPKSKALTTVANRHVQDIAENVGTLTHGWSDAPYDAKDSSTWQNMWKAPQRLNTGYPGNGYENAFGGSGGFVATAESAFNSWKNSPLHNAVILNQNIWQNKQWKALGVGIYQGYAVIWVGEETDPTGEPSIGGAATPTPTPTPTSTPPRADDLIIPPPPPPSTPPIPQPPSTTPTPIPIGVIINDSSLLSAFDSLSNSAATGAANGNFLKLSPENNFVDVSLPGLAGTPSGGVLALEGNDTILGCVIN